MPQDYEGPQVNADKTPKFRVGNHVRWTNPHNKDDKRLGRVTRDSGPNKTLVLLDGDPQATYLDNDDLERLTN